MQTTSLLPNYRRHPRVSGKVDRGLAPSQGCKLEVANHKPVMNYLAHLLLSSHSPEMLVGGLLGDFVKGTLAGRSDTAITQGILLHRKIDRFTDNHEILGRSRSLISRQRRRFAGIVVDVSYDHFLARHWQSYATVPLADFAQETYRILTEHQSQLPEKLQRILPRMTRDDWLGSYVELDAIDAVLNGIGRRLRRPNPLSNAIEEIEENYAILEMHFRCFFPDLVRYVAAMDRFSIPTWMVRESIFVQARDATGCDLFYQGTPR